MNVEEVSAIVVDAAFHLHKMFKEGIKRIVNHHYDFASSRLRVNMNLTGSREEREA
jgi:hypothetical protein